MMITPKTILWVAHEANVSGANFALLEYIEACGTNNLRHLMIIPHKGNMQKKAEELGIKVIVIPFYDWTRKKNETLFYKNFLRVQIRNFFAVCSFLRIILKYNINLIFTNTITFNVAGWAAKISGRSHRWIIHEMGEEDFGYHLAWKKYSYRFMAWVSEKIYFNSYHVASKYQKLLPKVANKVMYYPVFVNTRIKRNTTKLTGRFSMLIMGQLLESKGQHESIQALDILIKKNIQVQLTIAGSCNSPLYKQQLNDMIKVKKLSTLVEFKPFLERPNEEMLNHDVLLVCSRCEAFGRVTIEAMKLGLPVIGANTCGTKELINNKETGLSYQKGNPESLANMIELLIENIDLQKKLKISAKSFAERVCNAANVKNELAL